MEPWTRLESYRYLWEDHLEELIILESKDSKTKGDYLIFNKITKLMVIIEDPETNTMVAKELKKRGCQVTSDPRTLG